MQTKYATNMEGVVHIEGGAHLKGKVEIADEDNPLITIITATFNADADLPRTIRSIRELTYTNVEWIVVDGASSDKTLELIRQNEDVIDYWISESDDGIYDAWNKGVAVARGEWIAFLGAGDIYTPDSITTYIDAINSMSEIPDLISSRVRLVSGCGSVMREWGDSFNRDTFLKYMNIAHVGALHHRGLFEKNGHFDPTYKFSADYDFFMRCGSSIKFMYIGVVTADMLVGGVSNGYKGIYETYLIQKKYGAGIVAEFRFLIACAKRFIRPVFRGY